MLWRVTSRKKEQESPRVGVLSRISWLFARGSVHLSVKLCSSGQRAVAKPRARGKIQVWRYLKLSLAALCYVFSGQPGFLAEGATGGAFPWNRATFTVSLTYQIYIQIIYIICIWYVYDMYIVHYILYIYSMLPFLVVQKGVEAEEAMQLQKLTESIIEQFVSSAPWLRFNCSLIDAVNAEVLPFVLLCLWPSYFHFHISYKIATLPPGWCLWSGAARTEPVDDAGKGASINALGK